MGMGTRESPILRFAQCELETRKQLFVLSTSDELLALRSRSKSGLINFCCARCERRLEGAMKKLALMILLCLTFGARGVCQNDRSLSGATNYKVP
jgi:hypothetical protein